MKKCYISLKLLVCLISTIVSISATAQTTPKKPIETPNGPTTNIVGGANANINAVPWQVLLDVNGGLCGGTIIAPGWILTAAHCLENSFTGVRYQANQIQVFAGVTLRSNRNSGQVRTVTQIIRHNNWGTNANSRFDNDIALLRLNTPLTFNANVQGIRYATANDVTRGLTNAGVITTVSGWGQLAEGGSTPDHLQSVNVPIVVNATAVAQYNNLPAPDDDLDVTGNMIAAGVMGTGGTGVCFGDSGGPLIIRDGPAPVLAGVISYGIGCARPDFLQLYTRVSSFCDWISDRIAAIENGASTLCTSNATYNLRHGPVTGTTVTWSATPANLFATNTGTGTAATLRAASSSVRGQGTLTFTINGGCGTTTVSRTFQVGSSISIAWFGTGPFGQVDVTVTGGSPPYRFYRNGSLIFTSVTNTNTITIPFGCNGGTLRVEAGTPCGTASTTTTIPPGCASGMMVYPNPANEQLTIEQVPPADSSLATASMFTERTTSSAPISFSVKLYNSQQKVVATDSTKDTEIQLNTSKLPAGTYYLHIHHQEGTLQKQVVIE
ncbi:MAG: trypsin-like serine protease [Tunicatimonas sp.]|uniref:trypsin-like serine protease n=1 Tax=Tunicatimonas sp. TaxID=1940096 RepID=UPI003C74854D